MGYRKSINLVVSHSWVSSTKKHRFQGMIGYLEKNCYSFRCLATEGTKYTFYHQWLLIPVCDISETSCSPYFKKNNKKPYHNE